MNQTSFATPVGRCVNDTLRASVVVPVRNRPDLLARTLETLTGQDFPATKYEIIVCDDGSTDDLTSTLRNFASGPVSIRLETQAPLGPAAARNLGIRKSHAPVLIFVDSDVQADQALIRCLVEALQSHLEWMGAEAALHPAGRDAGMLWDAPASTGGGRYHTAAIAYRREVLVAVGGFDEEFGLPACEDVELAVRVLEHGPIGFVSDAKAWHPRRKVTVLTHWRWRRHWRYETVLAMRYGILTFPGKSCGSFPRLRVALAAVATLPAGRFLSALKSCADAPPDAFLAALYGLFDVLCGLWVLPSIFFAQIPARRDYLGVPVQDLGAKHDCDEPRRRFAVVVGAHRSYATLGLCLQGFRALVRHPADLIFVDNASRGGALTDWVKHRFSDVTVLTLDENKLFCGGYNAGIRQAMERGYDYVLIVNADTEVVNPGFIANLVEVMERHPRAAFAGPLVYYRSQDTTQTTCLRFPSLLRSALVWLPYRLFPRAVSRQPNQERQVDFLNGVCVLCRVQALREIGLMDETFGAYVEDADWSWRARQLGWNSLFIPVPSLVHHEEPHGYEHHSFKSFLLKRNTVHWLLKAGRRRSARGYAMAAIALARLRACMAADREEQQAYSGFAIRLEAVYRRLLRGEAMGPWYGPPLDRAGPSLSQPRSLPWGTLILLRKLTLLSLFIYVASLAATQTTYGATFSMIRWVSLFAFAGFGAIYWLTTPKSSLGLQSVNARVLIYIALWGLTVLNAEYPLFSSYRWGVHAMVVVSSLVFLPQVLRITDANRLLNALKLIVAVILVVSYFQPAPRTTLDDPNLFRGILGNPNSLGHMAAVGCLIFFHGYLTSKGKWWSYLQAILAALAGLLIIRSGARSSVAASLVTFLFLYTYYKAHLSRYLVVGILSALVALAIAPSLPGQFGEFALKKVVEDNYAETSDTLGRLAYSRQSILERSWRGFEERPLLGWGFGLDSDTNLSKWHGEWTALGSTGRDTVNDFTYTLESGGITGLFAYVLIMSLAFKAWIPWVVRSRLDIGLQRPEYEPLASAYEVQKVLFCLVILLIVMFEFDNTALSAGNFFSALVWVSLGASIGLYASLMSILRGLGPRATRGVVSRRTPLAA